MPSIYAVDDNLMADLPVKTINGKRCIVVPKDFNQEIVRAYPTEQIYKVVGKGVNLSTHILYGERVIILPDGWKQSHAKLVNIRKVMDVSAK